MPRKNRQVENALITMGQALKEARLKRNMTQQFVAIRTGLSVGSVQHLESGNSGSSLKAFCSYLLILGLDQCIISNIEAEYPQIFFQAEIVKHIFGADKASAFCDKICCMLLVIRKKSHLSRAIICDRIGMPLGTLRNIEAGKGGSSLYNFFSYCFSLNMLDVISRSIAPENDQIGNMYLSSLRKRARISP